MQGRDFLGFGRCFGNAMKIGELARRAGVRIDTVRYYERQGLLLPPTRRPSGYRTYETIDVVRLRFVRRAKGLGFSLDEIRELLALSDQRAEDVEQLKTVVIEKLAEVEAKLAELSRMRDALRSLKDARPGQGLERGAILAALDEGPI